MNQVNKTKIVKLMSKWVNYGLIILTFLGMEVWQNANGISLGQGKYAVEILKRFKMMDYKAMTTPIALNLKLLSVYSSKSVDATTVSLDDWVLDVPDKHETRYLLCCEHLDLVPDRSKTCSLDCCKAYSEVLERYNLLWAQV